jgi:hypothetical protein
VSARVLPVALFVFAFATEATAQNRFHWRPGQIVGGLANKIEDVFRDKRETEISYDLVEAVPVTPADQNIAEEHHHGAQHSGRHEYRPASRSPLHQKRTNWQPSPQSTRAASIDDVIKMVHRGLGESTIVRYIGDNGVKKRLDVSDLLRLHDEGVSEPIINAMQTAKVFDSMRHSHFRLPVSQSRPARPAPDFYNPSRETVDAEKYGPSILAPPEHLPLPPPPLRIGPVD